MGRSLMAECLQEKNIIYNPYFCVITIKYVCVHICKYIVASVIIETEGFGSLKS